MSARDPFGKRRFCRGCACTERAACVTITPAGPVARSWILLDIDTPTGICSACAVELGWDVNEFANIGIVTPEECRPRLVL